MSPVVYSLTFIAGVIASFSALGFLMEAGRPQVAIDNRIYYAPIEMRYHYCIQVTNLSRRHCLYDLEFASDLICPAKEEALAPLLQVWSLNEAFLRPGETRMYYLYMLPKEGQAPALPDTQKEATAPKLLEEEDFRSVFQLSPETELQILLKCRHGHSGHIRVFYKKFMKKDFYNHLKLEA